MTEPSAALLTDATAATDAVTGPILAGALGIGFLLVSAALLMSLARLVIGPDKPDRIVALDTLYVNTVALLVLLGIHLSNDLFFEAALLIALIGFISTVALAKFLTRGDIIE